MLQEIRVRDEFFPRAQFFSVSLHAGVIFLLVTPLAIPFLNLVPSRPLPPLFGTPLEPLKNPFPRRGGGGGGNGKEGPAPRGQIRFATLPIAPIMPIMNPQARLQVLPAVEGPPELVLPNPNVPAWGDPSGKNLSDRYGRGGPGGAGGPGCCGVGPDDGPGYGDANAPGAGERGYGTPVCIYCPNPTFTDEAIKAKYQGTVLIRAVVNAKGEAAYLTLVRGIGLGMDERALETVRRWRFQPALGPDGQPAATRVLIEVQFRQF
jgi:TonB family protein